MSIYLDDGDVRLYHGDALEQLALMPSESAQCIVTSPPFWGLRDYGTGSWVGGAEDCDHDAERVARRQDGRQTGLDGGTPGSSRDPIRTSCRCGATRVDQQIGLEETPDQWCAKLVAVMREARRVLRSDGVCWIEVGDTYGTNGSDWSAWKGGQTHKDRDPANARPHPFKAKDLVGAPWLLAFALRADGWYLRSDTIWARPNPMPESVTDRPTKAHSYVFLLSRSHRYFYDADAIREAHQDKTHDVPVGVSGKTPEQIAGNGPNGRRGTLTSMGGQASRTFNPAGRNARSVWSIPTEPTPYAHFATFPQALVERCIKAGTSEHGACGECGAPWRRITERTLTPHQKTWNHRAGDDGLNRAANWKRDGHMPGTPSWEASCAHDAPVVPCRVLDCFMGSGTTARARRLVRRSTHVLVARPVDPAGVGGADRAGGDALAARVRVPHQARRRVVVIDEARDRREPR